MVVKALLDSSIIELVMSKKFARKNKFRRTKLERLIYIKNTAGILNYAVLIVDMIEVELFSKEYKERTSINMIEGQKWSVILEML